jgi:hypothetical protein
VFTVDRGLTRKNTLWMSHIGVHSALQQDVTVSPELIVSAKCGIDRSSVDIATGKG